MLIVSLYGAMFFYISCPIAFFLDAQYCGKLLVDINLAGGKQKGCRPFWGQGTESRD
jgi:hypothetical protein